MTDWENPQFTCPKCGAPVKSTDGENVWAMSTFVCPKGDWTGDMPCGPEGHDEHDEPALRGKCRFCQQPMPSDDEEQ
jgi:hypothetical protein